MKNNIFKDMFNVGFSSAISMLLSLIATPAITRIVNPDDYGKFAIFNSYVSIFSSFLIFGLNDGLLRFFFGYKEETEKKSLFKFCLIIPLIASILFSAFAIILKFLNILNLNFENYIFILLCINVVLTIINSISIILIQNLQDTKTYSLAITVQKFIYCLLPFFLLKWLKHNHLCLLVLANIISLLFSTLICFKFSKEYWNFKSLRFPSNYKDVIKYSIPLYFHFIIYSTYETIDKLFIEHYCSDIDVGLYSAATSLVGVFSIVQTAFTVVWRPAQTKHYEDNPEEKQFIKNGNQYMTIIMFFIGVNVILFKDILCLFVGTAYRECSKIIPFLIFGPITYTPISTVTSGIEKAKKSIYKLVIIIVSIIVICAGCIILIPRIGAVGAAISLTISLLIQYLLTIYFSNKYYYINYNVKKYLLIFSLVFIYAFYCSFFDDTVINIVLYLINISVLFIIYKHDIITMKDNLKSLLKK